MEAEILAKKMGAKGYLECSALTQENSRKYKKKKHFVRVMKNFGPRFCFRGLKLYMDFI